MIRAKESMITAEDIIREIYGNNYTINDLKRIEHALQEQQAEWRKKKFKKEQKECL